MKKIRLVTNIISVVLIIGYLIFLNFIWNRIPATVPTHFNAAGEADAYGGKASLVLEPILMIGIFLLMTIAERFPSAWNFPVKVTEQNRERLFGIGYRMIGGLKILTVCIFIDAGISSIFPGFPVWPMYVMLILIGVVIISGIVACFKAR